LALPAIAAEEAFSIPEAYQALRGWAADADPAEPDQDFWDFVFTQDTPGLRRVRRQLLDLDGERLDIMDDNGVDVHVLSLTAPGVQTFSPADGTALARLANDRLAEVIKRHPGRFAGLAAVAPQDPKAAADEISRAITELRLNGVIINSHTGSEYLDDEKFWPILEAAEALGAPIYIHPRSPAAQMAAAFKKYGLETGIWGFQAETGLHGLRLICGGVFDQFPRLKIVLGHLGEGLPYWLYRLDYMHPVSCLVQHAARIVADAERVHQAEFRDHDQRHELGAGAAVLHRGRRCRQHHVRDRLPVPGDRRRRPLPGSGRDLRCGHRGRSTTGMPNGSSASPLAPILRGWLAVMNGPSVQIGDQVGCIWHGTMPAADHVGDQPRPAGLVCGA